MKKKEIKSETVLDKRRIYDRILEMCTPMYVGGTSKREAIASMKMEKAKRKLKNRTLLYYDLLLIVTAVFKGRNKGLEFIGFKEVWCRSKLSM